MTFDPVTFTNLIIGFILGAISSAIIAYAVYRKQKGEANESERKLVLLIHQQLKLSGQIFTAVGGVSHSQNELHQDFKRLQGEFSKAIVEQNFMQALILANQYSEIADAIAENSTKMMLASPQKSAGLSVDYLRELHKNIFPAGFELAGELRRTKIWIGGAGANMESASFVPPSPERVSDNFQDLLKWWNEKFPILLDAANEVKLTAIAEFHHKYLSIHPFFDGNKSVGLLVLGMQVSDLFNKKVVIAFNEQDYFEAIGLLSETDTNKLADLIRPLVM